MKKVIFHISGTNNQSAADAVSSALNDPSGVVAAGTEPDNQTVYAFAGDRLTGQTMEATARRTGVETEAVSEEYLNEVTEN